MPVITEGEPAAYSMYGSWEGVCTRQFQKGERVQNGDKAKT